MSKKILLATEKPFAKIAVEGIRRYLHQGGLRNGAAGKL